MGWLRVRNWDHWQYRSDRNLPWIKLHVDLLLDADFLALDDTEQGMLVKIWMVASRKNGCIPDDVNLVQRLINSSLKPPLTKFLELQFLESTGKRRRPKRAPSRLDQIRSDPPPIVPPQKSDQPEDVEACEEGPEFETWWRQYPRRVAKQPARRAWRSLSSADRVLAFRALEWWPFDDDPKFIPHAATWLRQRRFDDERQPPTRMNGNGRINGRGYETANDRLRRLEHDAARAVEREAGASDRTVVALHGEHIRR